MSVASILIISLVSVPDTNKQVSAYWIIWLCFIIELMFFTYSVKCRGPRIVPCGTPWFNSSRSENVFPSLTRCFRFSRKRCIKVMELSWNPNSVNFYFKIRWLIESNAFDKSRNDSSHISISTDGSESAIRQIEDKETFSKIEGRTNSQNEEDKIEVRTPDEETTVVVALAQCLLSWYKESWYKESCSKLVQKLQKIAKKMLKVTKCCRKCARRRRKWHFKNSLLLMYFKPNAFEEPLEYNRQWSPQTIVQL